MSPPGITKEAYDAVVAERDAAKRQAFELETKLQIAQHDLALARQDVHLYRQHWNSATAELKRMMDRACRKKPGRKCKR
jgi:hypothetical protein